MKVYIAGSFAARDTLAEVAKVVRAAGHEVTSSWLREPPLTMADEREEWEKRARANEDLIDLERADCVLMYTDVPSTSGGRLVEFGLATAHRKPIYHVGPKENIFFWMNHVYPMADVHEFLGAVNRD